MAKRKRSKFTWFPCSETQTAADHSLTGITFSLEVDRTGEIATGIVPLTYDAPSEPLAATINDPGQLAGIVGQEYFLRRIVGKCLIQFSPVAGATDGIPSPVPAWPPAACVTAGIFVARASDDDGPGGADLPIGSADLNELRESYSPLASNTIREPWIWRRSWILGNAAFQNQYNFVWPSSGIQQGVQMPAPFPWTTAHYGSVADGPHIDAKTARRVTQDERLWFAVSTTIFPLGITAQIGNDGAIQGWLDYRILAGIRRARNRGVF